MHRDPQLKSREHFWVFDHPSSDPIRSIHRRRIWPRPRRALPASPCLGEHNEQVCCEILGICDEDFVALLEGGAFG